MPALPAFQRSLFLEGPAGSGKTRAAIQYLNRAIQKQGIAPEQVLVLVPPSQLNISYQQDISIPPGRKNPLIATLSSFARRSIRRFWPLLKQVLPVDAAVQEPVFLTSDLAGYYITRFARPYLETGVFDGVHLPTYRIALQILDSINNAALAGFTLNEAENRLIYAWGERRDIYRTVIRIAHSYQNFCLKRGLLDYALQIRLLVENLLDINEFQEHFERSYDYLAADNVEEMGALAHDFIFWCMEYVHKTIIIYDTDGGFRTFLGADPAHAYLLADVCSDRAIWEKPASLSASMLGIIEIADTLLRDSPADTLPVISGRSPALHFISTTFYPQMIDRCAAEIAKLVHQKNVAPKRIAVIAPYLSDSLLFALQSRFDSAGIPAKSYRPSRPLILEPIVRAMVIFLRLYIEEAEARPQPAEVSFALQTAVEGLDPVRAALLTRIVYRNGELVGLEKLTELVQTRLTESICRHYEQMFSWFTAHQAEIASSPPDGFISRFAEEIILQPGFAGYSDVSFRAPINNFVAAARSFTEAVYNGEDDNWTEIMRSFVRLTLDGLVSPDADLEPAEAVFIGPAHTYLTRDLRVDYQFWLDIGDDGWTERIEQPLTHPYVLRRGFPDGDMWTDDLETAAQKTRLRSLILGLLRRCHKGVFAAACDISASGYEQRGRLAFVLQQMFDRTRTSTP